MTEEKNKTDKNIQKLVDEITKLSVLELSELVGELQKKLGVSATPQMVAAAPAVTQTGSGEVQQTAGSEASATQTVIMKATGNNKIAVIKALREINQNLGLKEAKDLTEAVPVEILKDVKSEEAKSASEKLKAAGATVELK